MKLWLLVPFVLSFVAAQPAQAAERNVLALTHATVIDGTGTPAQPDVTVVVTDDRITAVGKSRDIRVPTNAIVVDATGKYLIPGLWDMHVHWYDQEYLPLFLANGVTGIRLMLGAPMHYDWRKEIELGKLPGPRMFIASPIVDGPKPVWPGSISAASAAEGREAVSKVKQDGADFLKVYSLLSREAYFAIADEAKKQGISFAGHVPITVSVEEAAAAGQRCIEHLTGVLSACSSQEDRLLRSAQASFAEALATNDPMSALTQVRRDSRLALQTYSPGKADALFALLKSNHTWQCPTLVVLRNIRYQDEASITNDARLKYLPPAIKASWDPSLDFQFRGRTPEDVALGKQVYQKERELVGAMQHAGLDILAGTDTLNPYCFPGFSLHDELALLVQAGLTPMQALQAATRNAARFMGREHELGTIEPGKLADLVLLEANPLEAITNTRRIHAVVYRGQLFPRSALDEMLSKAEALAAKSKMPIAAVLAKTIEQQGVDAALRQYHALKSAQAAAYDFSEEELNSLAYVLLGMRKINEAVQILRLNAEAYPQSANAYDSLGEAYLNAGDKQRAAENYERSLQLDPNNVGAVEKLKQLKPQDSAKSQALDSRSAGATEKSMPLKAQRWAKPVDSIRLVLPSHSTTALESISRIFARQVSQRCGVRTISTGRAPLRVTLAIEPGFGAEGFRIADAGKNGVRIIGNDARGLLYGVGKFLHSSRYDQGGFTPGGWRRTSVPQCSCRDLGASTHFMNFYEAAPMEEVQAYIEDVGLWGANSVTVGLPTWDFKGFDDPGARRSVDRMRRILQAAKACGLLVGLGLVPNQGFADAPPEIRASAFPDGLGRRGFFGVNICPGKPAGHEYLLKLYGRLFDEFKDVGLDDLECWPYDEGGCGCTNCWPWGAKGYPKISRDVVLAARARFPGIKATLSTWCYDTPPAGEWAGLAKFLETDHSWLDYILADSHTDFPRYPLEQGVPGGLPLINFPEISMWGRTPWGGFGANPLPSRLQALWDQTQGKLAGGSPYSEGIYADMNQVICLQLYWNKSRTTDDIVKEYLAFEYSPAVVDELWEAVHLLEATWLQRGPDSPKAFELLQKAETKLTPRAKAAWRWRILYLRGQIDSELFRRHDKMEGPILKAAFEELTRLYHAEHVHGMPVRPPEVTE